MAAGVCDRGDAGLINLRGAAIVFVSGAERWNISLLVTLELFI